MKSVQVIIHPGGKCTRFKGVILDVPKPMAPIGEGKPFLEYLVLQLILRNVRIRYSVKDEHPGTISTIREVTRSVKILPGHER